jgi:hypothetical protein
VIWTPPHSLVDRHFAGAGSPRADRRLFGHLRTCDRCRARYRARTLLEEMEGAPVTRSRTRLARGLFAPPRPVRPWMFAALTAAVAVTLFLGRPDRGFQARGGGSAVRPALTLYRLGAGGAPERTGAVIKAGDALAFSYLNPTRRPHSHLMVLATDAGKRVFWFWPAWQDPGANPTAVPILPGDAPVELGEAVRQPLAPGVVTVTALFCDRPVTVREVETALAAGEPGLAALGGERWVEQVEVLP